MSLSNTRVSQSRFLFPKLAASAVLSLSLLSAAPAAWSQDTDAAVKMSGSGICHDASSRHFDRVKSFTPYPSMQACLEDGGRKPKK
ncbi:MAG TPA: hypothetical protein VMW70_15410 [Burkholderiales bacterium]|nr:hypothetical protein [Burkholderiales bacterium]